MISIIGGKKGEKHRGLKLLETAPPVVHKIKYASLQREV